MVKKVSGGFCKVNQFNLIYSRFVLVAMETKKTCANCTRELDVGVDAIKVDEGVIGVKDFVPLEKVLFFCSERCIRDYFDMSDLPSMPKRIP